MKLTLNESVSTIISAEGMSFIVTNPCEIFEGIFISSGNVMKISDSSGIGVSNEKLISILALSVACDGLIDTEKLPAPANEKTGTVNSINKESNVMRAFFIMDSRTPSQELQCFCCRLLSSSRRELSSQPLWQSDQFRCLLAIR